MGGGAATDNSIKTTTMIDTMASLTGWSSYAGTTLAWGPQPNFELFAAQGPSSSSWMRGFSASGTIPDGNVGFRLEKAFTTSDISTINNIGFYIANNDTWQTNSNPQRIYQIKLYLGSDGDETFTNSVVATLTPSIDTLAVLQFVAFDRTDFVIDNGTFDWTDFQDVRIEVLGSNGSIGAAAGISPPLCYFQGLQTNHYYTPTVILGHDDGPEGMFNLGKPVMDSFGFKSTQFVLPELIDANNVNNISLAQVGQMYDEGHDVCLHATYSGDVLNTLTDAAFTTDLQLGQAWLTTNGWTRAEYCISYPEGVMVSSEGTETFSLFATEGITVARGSDLWHNHDEHRTVDTLLTGLPNQSMRLAVRAIDTNFPYNTFLRPALDRLYKYGGVLFLNFHNVVVSGAAGAAISLADYTAALQIVKDYETKGKLQVKTISQVFDASGNLLIAGG